MPDFLLNPGATSAAAANYGDRHAHTRPRRAAR
jgi:hypothetical protein